MNQKIVKIFTEMAELLGMKEVAFKPAAYENAAASINHLDLELNALYKKGGVGALQEIPGIGKGMAEKIEEYIKTGRIKEYDQLKKKMPVNIFELTAVEGVGPKMIKLFYEKLKIRNLKDLEKAAKAGKISKLPRCGEKFEQKILKGIEFLKKHGGRFLLGDVYFLAKQLEKKYGGVIAGSFRRRQETVGDLDILIPALRPAVGEKRKTIYFENGLKSDLRFIDKKSWGSALQYFTGDKEHNIALRKIAIAKGYKLNEYDLWDIRYPTNRYTVGKTEEEVYKKLGMQWIPPEIRRNEGEIELAQKNKLPELVELKDIKGDLHCHSHWKINRGLMEERVKKAVEMGYQYLGISDHTKFLAIEHGLDEKELLEQSKQIKNLNKKFKKIIILHGCEANIMTDGSIDIDDEVLAKLDYVIVGVHSQMNMPEKEMTERIIMAMRNPHVDIISHLTGRIIHRRQEFQLDLDKILRVAKETGTVLEINSNPARLDLKDVYIKKAKEAGVKMIINSDAHQNDQLELMEFGVGQARRGWAEKKDIINTMPLEKILEFFKKPKNPPRAGFNY
ncbi:DNA polymerase/3'-5' exonuclease PolX [Patescibacteria group bacterium]|nr:DNA polymerase/3'-5' exonuclease PolX [Patescibacteria group bacterium]